MMPDNDSHSASPALTPLSQPNAQGTSPIPRLGTFCETPSGNLIELPQFGAQFDKLVRDYCHKATLDYLMKQRLELVFPIPPGVLSSAIVKQVDLEEYPVYDGATFKTPALQLGKFDAAAIFSVKPALPIGGSSLTGAGVSLGYRVSPLFRISATGSAGEQSTDSFSRKIPPQQAFGVTIMVKGSF
ncbi:hypothetical protein CR492_11000 [Methylocella silvestris]|uniref:Uncharacterized protein n=2 Tax=Methylocella silvestris TaxID=199596 RepID=A0A2J7TGG7_METSI|nr:hypothetical protein CR492_11000 [Methylocella silvestris]